MGRFGAKLCAEVEIGLWEKQLSKLLLITIDMKDEFEGLRVDFCPLDHVQCQWTKSWISNNCF